MPDSAALAVHAQTPVDLRGPALPWWLRLNVRLFPAPCLACGRLQNGFAPSPGQPDVCAACFAELPWREEGGLDAASASLESPLGIQRVWAVWHYEDPVRGWIHQLKYRQRDPLAAALGRLAASALADTVPTDSAPLDGVDLVAPVPLHRRRLRERGFNQAALVGHALLRELRRRGHRVPPLVPDLLARTRYTTPQVHLDAEERSVNVEGAFGPGRATLWRQRRDAGAGALQGARVLLVDDVMTTGSTLTACAAILYGAGAAAVDVFVLARTQ
jgi:ComF family protein